MTAESLQPIVDFFKALADPSRLRILGLLAQQERSVGELATLLELKEPTVSHHLKRLRKLSLVSMRREGNTHLFTMDDNGLQLLNAEVFKRETTTAVPRAPDSYEDKVLKTFVVDDRLTAIPARRKKRGVILRYLVERFEMERDYPELELNEIIREFHPDAETLRREMIANGLMTRQRGVYRRVPESS